MIAGAGGFGRELESWLELVSPESRDWFIHGYLDDNERALDRFPSDYQVVGDIDSFPFLETDLVVLAIGNPDTKRAVVERLNGRVEFFTFLAPGARLGKHVSLGKGTVVGVNCILTTNIEVGDFVTINSFSAIGHDVKIGSWSSLMGNVMVNGGCVLGEGAYIGTSVSLIPGRRIGNGSIVGAGAIVFRHVAEGTTVIGNPAKVL